MNGFLFCLLVGLLIFVITLFIGIYFFKKRSKKRAFIFSCLGIFLSLFFLLFPFQSRNFIQFPYVIYNAIRVFTGDFDIPSAEMANLLGGESSLFFGVYLFILSLIYLCAILLAAGFIFNFLPGITSRIKFYFHPSAPLYIFSVLDERTIITGKDIRQREMARGEKRSVIVYLNSNSDQDEIEYLKDESKEIGSLIFNVDIKNFTFHPRNGATYILLAKKNDVENIQDFIELFEEKKLDPLTSKNNNLINLYIFSSTEEYENLINTFENDNEATLSKFRIFTVDELSNIVYSLFFNHPLFENLTEEGESIRLLVIGNTRLAKLIVRTATWMGQMNAHPLEIDYFCKEAELVKSEFKFLYPELIDKKNYDIDFYDFNKPETLEEIKKLNPTYIVIAHKEELKNLETALELFTTYGRNNLTFEVVQPIIALWNSSSSLEKQLSAMKDRGGKGIEINLIPFGSLAQQYSYDTIFHSRMNEIGYQVHKLYDEIYHQNSPVEKLQKTFYRDEYNRKSSIASGIHTLVYKKEDLRYFAAPETDFNDLEQLESLVQKNMVLLAKIEHNRWMAYMRGIGYEVLDIKTLGDLYRKGKISKHESKDYKVHSCLVDWTPTKGNTLRELGLMYENSNLSQLEDLMKNGDLDELDKVSIACWILEKKKHPDSQDGVEDMHKNFKEIDENILRAILTDKELLE